MKDILKPLENIFLETTLKVSLVTMVIILIADLYPEGFVFNLSTGIDLIIFAAILLSYILFKFNYYTLSASVVILVVLFTMNYQSIAARNTTNISMAVIEVVGFSIALLIKGKLRLVLHAIALIGIVIVTAFQVADPIYYQRLNEVEAITYSVTYLMMYFILAYTTGRLKSSYDASLVTLTKQNAELQIKASEINTQNEALKKSQEELNDLNLHLEEKVKERTQRVITQNEMLVQYSYSNAHLVRGPLARILGLISLKKLDHQLDNESLLNQIEEQANELDVVVRQINEDITKHDIHHE